jgi:hypothetical protein
MLSSMRRLAVFVLVLAGCARSASSDSKATTDVGAAVVAADAARAACAADGDCRLFDDYCTACECRALLKSDPDPPCPGPGVRCLRQPCADRVAACVQGQCVVREIPRR